MNMEYPKFKVTVSCMTYNQAKYIIEALNGFTMQQTSFPFICTIVDDASTDGEQEVIRRYMEDNFNLAEDSIAYKKETDYAFISYARHKTNENCYFAVLYLKKNLYLQPEKKRACLKEWRDGVEYMTICEGDDYWTNPLKLQRQVDFLDANSDFSLCFHSYYQLHPDGKQIIVKNRSKSFTCNINDAILMGGGFMATNSMMYRTICVSNYPIWATRGVGDYPLMLILFHKGKVGYLDFLGSVYRINSIGSWSEKMSNLKFLINHYRETDAMLVNFDKWSERKYHNVVMLKRCKDRLVKIKLICKSLYRNIRILSK